MDEAVVESDGDRLSLSHMKEAACSSRSSRSASVKAAGAWKSLQKWLRPRGNPRRAYEKRMANEANSKKLQEHRQPSLSTTAMTDVIASVAEWV